MLFHTIVILQRSWGPSKIPEILGVMTCISVYYTKHMTGFLLFYLKQITKICRLLMSFRCGWEARGGSSSPHSISFNLIS